MSNQQLSPILCCVTSSTKLVPKKRWNIANAIMLHTSVSYSTLSGSRLFRRFPGWPYLLLIFLVAPILALWTVAWPTIQQTTSGLNDTSSPPTSLLTQQNCASIESAIANATRYLLDHRDPVQGYFSYVIQSDGTEIPDDYNILRHAGVMYALAMRYERKPSSEIRQALDKGIKYFRLYISPFGESPTNQSSRNIHAVWNYPPSPSAANQITNWYPNDSSVAQLGGAGLGLVAYSYITRSLQSDLPIAIPDDHIPLARFIAELQDPNTGKFFSRWFADAPVPDTRFDSLYYPGEAALGLYLLQDLLAVQAQSSPDLDWIVLTAMRGLSFLANLRDNLPVPSYPNDHWALLATERAVPLWNRAWNGTTSHYINRVVSREKIVMHAMRVGMSMLQPQVRDDRNPVVDGALIVDDDQEVLDVIELVAPTTPTATRVEGLMALWKTLAWLDKEEIEKVDPTRAEAMDEIKKGLDRAVAFLLRAQIKKGKLVGGIPAGVSMVYLNTSSLNDVRMDYVQHTMSGWMSYKEIFCL